MNIFIGFLVYLLIGLLLKWSYDRTVFKNSGIDDSDDSYEIITMWLLMILIFALYYPIEKISESKIYNKIRSFVRGY
jgi:hypothetical protein